MITLTLPLPPSDNALTRCTCRNGKARLYPTKAKKWFERDATAWLRIQKLPERPIEGPVAVTVAVYFPNRRGDLTNRIKAVHDVLEGVAYNNDAQIMAAAQTRYIDRAHPRVEVTVEPMAEHQGDG